MRLQGIDIWLCYLLNLEKNSIFSLNVRYVYRNPKNWNCESRLWRMWGVNPRRNSE